MNHFASPSFWQTYDKLPKNIQKLADKNFELLKENSQHPSLHLKKVGSFWSARIGNHYPTLAVEIEDGRLWFWIGTHAEYDHLTK